MERLSFEKGARYSSFEAAIHVARYLFVKEMCVDRRVLDVACGEGYGAALMAKWGAQSVRSIDISSEAIASAQANFANAKTVFSREDVRNADALKQDAEYDLVVSLETVEHVDDPEAFLLSLRRAVARNGNIVISCPNDAWYYKTGGSNPFHKSRFTFDEFRTFSEKALGPATFWNIGTFGIGFASVPWPGGLAQGGTSENQILMLRAREVDESLFVPMQDETAPHKDDVSYYLGVWGPLAQSPTVFCGYPVSMDLAGPLLHSDIGRLRANLAESQSQIEQAKRLLEEEERKRLVLEDDRQRLMLEVHEIAMRRAACEAEKEQLRAILDETRAASEAEKEQLLEEEERKRLVLEDDRQQLLLQARKIGMRRAASEAEKERLRAILDETRRELHSLHERLKTKGPRGWLEKHFLQRLARRPRQKYLFHSMRAAIAGSDLFDCDWYLRTNADVASVGMDPVKHYIEYGAAEGRDPGPFFSTRGYLAANPDVDAAGVNPLFHYLQFGHKEGRRVHLPRESGR